MNENGPPQKYLLHMFWGHDLMTLCTVKYYKCLLTNLAESCPSFKEAGKGKQTGSAEKCWNINIWL